MGGGGIVDIGGVDDVSSVPHPDDLARPGLGDDPGDDLGVSGPPDEVGAQGKGLECRAVGRQDHPLRLRLRRRIGRAGLFRIGHGLVHSGHVGVTENDAGGTGEDQPAHTGTGARRNDVLGADDVRTVK